MVKVECSHLAVRPFVALMAFSSAALAGFGSGRG